ncbi:MAG: glycine--tRNA ligase subunit beta [bacterium]|nr:glycine--tRNA ligase subunit beta [bacterium]
MGKELLFEIGVEEIPSAYMPGMLRSLKELAEKAFREARLDFKGLTVCGTPRRLVLHVADLAEKQSPLKEELLGPPVSAAFDAEGNPTKAALGFAKTHGVDVSVLSRKNTPKGERLMYLREDAGMSTDFILSSAAECPLIWGVLWQLPAPKSMRWGEGHLKFVRPIHWVLALYGRKLINYTGPDHEEGPPVLSYLPHFGNTTRGHRFMAQNKELKISNFADYLQKLREAHVEPIVDDGEGNGRIPMVRKAVEEAAEKAGGELAADPEGVTRLVEKVAHLVEWPFPVACAFEEKFLDLPEEVIITTLETHQRFFAIRKKGGGPLLPDFVGVSNTKARDMAVVGRGYERVVRARLEDADFYWKRDLETPIEEMAEKLKEVVYHPKLGTSWEKMERFAALAGWLADHLFPGDAALRGQVVDAARLCKADLTSGMVYEFPELQGVMGERYAARQGVDPAVSKAIREHYLPRGEGDALPEGDAGALVGLADRMDTLAGMLGLGYVPTGSEDPFALRRAANAIIQILFAKGYRLSLADFAGRALAGLEGKVAGTAETGQRVSDFLRNRVGAALAREAAAGDLVEATLSAGGGHGWHDPVDARARLRVLHKLSRSADTFEPLTTTFKRVSNIVRQAREEGLFRTDDDSLGMDVSEALLQEKAEKRLASEIRDREDRVREALASIGASRRDDPDELESVYLSTSASVTEIRPAVDEFFDEVLVMAEDVALRKNRLVLLAKVASLFAPLADFSKVQGRSQ